MDEFKALQDQIDAQQIIINAAYWDFTRGGGKNRKPPILVVPKAYKKRNELTERLNNMKSIGST